MRLQPWLLAIKFGDVRECRRTRRTVQHGRTCAVLTPFNPNPSLTRAADGTWLLFSIGQGTVVPANCTKQASGSRGWWGVHRQRHRGAVSADSNPWSVWNWSLWREPAYTNAVEWSDGYNRLVDLMQRCERLSLLHDVSGGTNCVLYTAVCPPADVANAECFTMFVWQCLLYCSWLAKFVAEG